MWDDVGLNIPKPPDLLQLYRNCGTPLPSPRDTVDVSVGVDFGDLPGNCIAQDAPKKPDLSQQVCVCVCTCMGVINLCTVLHELDLTQAFCFWQHQKLCDPNIVAIQVEMGIPFPCSHSFTVFP